MDEHELTGQLQQEVVEVYRQPEYREVVEVYTRPLPESMAPKKVPEPPAPIKKRRKKWPWILLVLVLLLVGGVFTASRMGYLQSIVDWLGLPEGVVQWLRDITLL